MAWSGRLGRLALWPLALSLLVGCPISGSDDGGTGSGGGASAGGVAGTTASDPLAQEFPGCGEPLLGDELRDEVLDRINLERQAYGLEPLRRNATLEDQADRYACEMIYYGFFAHENPVTGSTLAERADESGYQYLVVGENLAAGQRFPSNVVDAWMGSAGHRQNILDERFVEVGIGVKVGGQYETYWVAEFGCPR